MQPLGNKTVIRQTFDNVLATGLFDAVYVVTDHEKIFNEIVKNGGKAIMSKHSHESGSDRIAEAAATMHADIISVSYTHLDVYKRQILSGPF